MVKGVYKITNNRTGEIYVGQAVNLDSRKNRHFRELAKGNHHNQGMQDDHNRGDTFTFEVLEEMPDATKADLYNKESHYIKQFNSFREGYNQTPGGAMDQFKGRYEFGGGRLPIEKYQPTDNYLNKDIGYCPECGNPFELEDDYCSSCGEKIDKNCIGLEGNNTEEKTGKINETNEPSLKIKIARILIVIILCVLVIFFILSVIYYPNIVLFFVNIIGGAIAEFIFLGIVLMLCATFITS